jgi:ribosomal protein S18 acetylase RimI-like enzyme
MLYRSFRNPDVPQLVAVWNDAFSQRGAVHFPCTTLFEEHVLAKLSFDPAGLFIALDQDRIVGFAHAGFGPNANLSSFDRTHGVIALIAVSPSHRRRGVGSELLRLCLKYLRDAGAERITAGDVDGNPFYFSLHGGSSGLGVLESDEFAHPFLARHSFQREVSFDVYHRRLAGSVSLGDGRFGELRRLYEFRVESRHGIRDWHEECRLGPIELHDFLLTEKATGQRVAHATLWEMAGFGQRWNESAAGLIEIAVREDLRRRGLARMLLSQTFRYLQDQFFSVVEVQARQDDIATKGLFTGVGCHNIDASHLYRLTGSE